MRKVVEALIATIRTRARTYIQKSLARFKHAFGEGIGNTHQAE